MSTSDAGDGSSRDGADCLAQAIYNLFKRLKHLVPEATFSYFFPYLLNWVHFWSVWRNIEQLNIIRYFEGSGFVPSSSVTTKNYDVFGIGFRKLLQKQVHELRVAIGHDPETSASRCWFYAPINIAILSNVVARHARTRSLFAPAISGLIDSAKACFILKHEANSLPCG